MLLSSAPLILETDRAHGAPGQVMMMSLAKFGFGYFRIGSDSDLLRPRSERQKLGAKRKLIAILGA